MKSSHVRTNSTGLSRDLDLLDALSRCDTSGAGVVRLAAMVGREKTQVSRALSTLADSGLVERDESTRAYRLGWKLHSLASRTLERRLATIAAPLLRQLTLRTGATSHLFALRGIFTTAICSHSIDNTEAVWPWMDRPVPAPVTSPGRVLISEWDADSIRVAFPDNVLAKYGENLKTTTTEKLLAELSAIRSQGYAVIQQEYDLGAGCAAAVRNDDNQIIAAINVEGPPNMFNPKLDEITQITRKYASVLASRISHSS
ncbi:IclR family transcriptional regulator [Pseudarthrobacter sp. H2]|uniref:IclR family transcriptional regulator n=1 Tax=Pseudarthrobacter sp. H2 TaxID=3418415 RepID=UPI003CF48217